MNISTSMNTARDKMEEKGCLAFIASYSDTWIFSVAICSGESLYFDKETR